MSRALRTLFVGFFALSFVSGFALAADMAVKAPPAPVAPPTWDGLYVGLNGGYSVGHDSFVQTDFGIGPFGMVTTPQGGLFGAQAGYNWQRGNVVVGLEGDVQWTGQQSTTCGVTCLENYNGEYDSVRISQRLSWFSTARARIGYADGNYLLCDRRRRLGRNEGDHSAFKRTRPVNAAELQFHSRRMGRGFRA
jgi:opacity protein-like surface antigen